MLICIKVKTLDAQTHEFSIDNEITVREFKDIVEEKTNISANQQRIIFCGRVMIDDKQLKDYDVDGKVVHVAERPPPSQRLPATDSSGSLTNSPNERGNRGRPVNMRSSPLFRAIDGMMVGTMASFPMNANTNGQDAVNPFAASSSFCMNRITVARHMLECANNIAAYLEDPSRGLNNQSLDILARGRWTMESTVVEVGITSDIPQGQQIVEMVQGAVQAALRRNGNTNVTLVQLPTVYSSSNENEANSSNAAALAGASDVNNDATVVEEVNPSSDAAASVLIEEVIDDDEDTPTNEQNDNNSATGSINATTSAAGENNDNAAAASNNDDSNDNSRRRTGAPVLASVIEQMRNVQNRLNPFIEQYYELLQNEPTFEENDTADRENAQRLFDRVSEAFHYMSHAQHAISDLVLDVYQATPRYLTCRPILVEQSGYVSSNHIINPPTVPIAVRLQQMLNARIANLSSNAANDSANIATSSETATASNNSNNATRDNASSDSISTSSTSSDVNNSTVDDPIDDPVIWQPTIDIDIPSNGNGNNENVSNNNSAAATRGSLQRQVARLLQDVVSAAPFDTDFHGGSGGSQTPQTSSTSSNNNENATSATEANDNVETNSIASSSSASATNTARVTTATLPTTSTQTRSTSRPQVHFGNIPVLGMPTGRVLPSYTLSSFDRFLPCNSHHIREPETASNAPNDNASNSTTSTSATANRNNPTVANIVTRRPLRTLNDIYQRMRPRSTRIVGSTMTNSPRAGNNSSSSSRTPLPIMSPLSVMFGGSGTASASSSNTVYMGANSTENVQRLNIHSQLMNCLNNYIFEGQPINDDTIPLAINRAIQWFGETLLYLPQYEKPEYDSRNSLFNVVRSSLPMIIDLLKKNPINLKEFEQKLNQIFEQFRKRLYSVLYICIGEENADLFWVQLMRLLCTSAQSHLQGDIVKFLYRHLTPAIPSAIYESDVQNFVVLRNAQASNVDNVQMPIDADVEMSEAATTSQPEVNNEPLASVIPGSETWHRHFPNDWLPIIARDIQRQATNPPVQPPFSDAYISGMSSKRRKLVQKSKAPTEICALIADSAKKAIQNPEEVGSSTNSVQGLTPEAVAISISRDPAVQSSCLDTIRNNVRERLKNDPDFEADKFPKANKFIKK